MAFARLDRTSLADGVFDQIVEQIVAGDLPDGQALPSERHLAEAFGVSRPAVREALQRLAEIGMVQIRQGESTTVQPWRRTAGPDLLARLLLRGDGGVDLRVAQSVLEVRQRVGPDIAGLAARRGGGPGLRQDLDAVLQTMAQTEDGVELQVAALAFWDLLVNAADNVAYRLMTNTLAAAYRPLIAALTEVMRPEVSNLAAYRGLADAVVGADEVAARSLAEELLEAGTGTVLDAISTLLANDPEDEA